MVCPVAPSQGTGSRTPETATTFTATLADLQLADPGREASTQ